MSPDPDSLSQGLQDQQRRLFKYLAFRRPSWRLTEAMLAHLRSLCSPVEALIDRGLHADDTGATTIAAELDLMSHDMGTTLAMSDTDRRRIDSSTLVAEITRSWIGRDWYYITRSGRPRPLEEENPSRSPHPRRDRYFSYVCHYLLLNRPLHITVFDELLADVRLALKQQQGPTYEALMQGWNIREELEAVIAAYNRHHPETQVTYQIK